MDEALHTHLDPVLHYLLLFFGIAGLLVPLLQRLRIPSILGYLLCGILVGPQGLGTLIHEYPWTRHLVVQDGATVQVLGELGIASLLFMIGLELSFERLRELKRYVLGLGNAQILVCGSIIGAIAYAFGNTVEISILLGASLALSSTAVVVHLLQEKGLFRRPEGQVCFSILLMQDLAVVPMLILAGAFGNQATDSLFTDLLYALALAVAVVGGIYLFGKKMLRPLLHTLSVTHSPEWLVAFTLFLIVALSAVTVSSGLSLGLGAFLAGLLIAETEFRKEIEQAVDPLKSLLLGIFFLSIGMMIDWRAVLAEPAWLLASVIGIFLLKAVVIYPLGRLFGLPHPEAFATAVFLCQPGEFALLILSAAMGLGLLPAENGQFFLLVTALALMLTPLVFRLVPRPPQ